MKKAYVEQQMWGTCDRCGCGYDIGPRGFKRDGEQCHDMSTNPNLPCRGIVWADGMKKSLRLGTA